MKTLSKMVSFRHLAQNIKLKIWHSFGKAWYGHNQGWMGAEPNSNNVWLIFDSFSFRLNLNSTRAHQAH